MIKKYIIPALILCITIASCKKDGSVGPQSAHDDAAFTLYKNNFLEGLWKLEPDEATLEGFHKFDSLLTIPNDKNREKLLYFAKLQIDSLSNYQASSLTPVNKMDYQVIENQMEYVEWQLQELRAFEWDPTSYNLLGSFARILNEPYAPLVKRLHNFYDRMGFLPEYYKEAEKSIHNPVKELTALAIDQMQNGLNIFGKEFADSLKKSGITASEQKQMLDRAAASAETIKAFTSWLQNLKNDHPRSFRLGKELYDAKFKYEIQSDMTPQQLYDAAVERKKHLHAEMDALSKQLWPKYFGNSPMPGDTLGLIARVIDTISAAHVKQSDFQKTVEGTISKLTAFVKSKNLMAFNPSSPLIVRREPGYMEGIAAASFSPPGPYDKNGNCYFNVANIGGWPADKAKSFLREYNNYTLQILCMHEAVPGHYLQYSYAAQSPDPLKSVFASAATVEGWAVYGEQLMIDSGYEKNTPEMKLMWYKWHLRSVCNTILDFGVHEQNMSRQDAMKLLTREAFQQTAEAEDKWKRVTETSVQLDSYFAGYKEIMNLRDAYKKQAGDKYSLKDFNEKFLSYGSVPVRYIRDVMMAQPKKPAGGDTVH